MKAGIIMIFIGLLLLMAAAVVFPRACLPVVRRDPNPHSFLGPGTTEVTIEKPGRYYFWNNYHTVFQGRSYQRSRILPDGLFIEVSDRTKNLPLLLTGDDSLSSIGPNSARASIGYIDIDSPADLEIEVTGSPRQRVFSLARSPVEAIRTAKRSFSGMVAIFIFAAVILLASGVIRLMRSRKTKNSPPSAP